LPNLVRLTPRSALADRPPGIVIATRNRCESLLQTLERLLTPPEQSEIVVVDNGSDDGTVDMVRTRFPTIRLLALDRNLGAAARTLGVMEVESDAVAFCDDDSAWPAEALEQASRLLAEHPRLGLVAARVLVGEAERIDPVCHAMQHSPLPPPPGLTCPSVLGFIACGAVVRRGAYLQAGGFHPRFGIGGEEELLALDLAAHGWHMVYVHDIVARHFPSPVRDVTRRREIVTRNTLWVSWLRDPARDLAPRTAQAIEAARRDAAVRRGVKDAVHGLPWVARERRCLPRRVQAARRMLAHSAVQLGE
jgi:GT2 family glycosyltransferase